MPTEFVEYLTSVVSYEKHPIRNFEDTLYAHVIQVSHFTSTFNTRLTFN